MPLKNNNPKTTPTLVASAVKINEVYFVSFVIDKESHASAITIMKALPDGTLKAVKLIKGEESERIYDMIFNS